MSESLSISRERPVFMKSWKPWVISILVVLAMSVFFGAKDWDFRNDPNETCVSAAKHEVFMTQAVTPDTFAKVCPPKPSYFIEHVIE